jgi:alpha-D-ribose 1-methylphosphonate 5-triphosphate synthase subunit PhnL
MSWMIKVNGLSKRFLLHTQGKVRIPVFKDFHLLIHAGESVGLVGPSGAGKSTLLRLLYGNYKIDGGNVLIRHNSHIVDMATASPHTVLDIRKWTIGYVSQFLRVIPRVPAVQVIMEPLKARGVKLNEAREKAEDLLSRLRIPRRLWGLSPTTFSGGEQQRINIAKGFVANHPVMLLDEPTASLDPLNRLTVIRLIQDAIDRGTAVIGIFHDETSRQALLGRCIDIEPVKNGGDLPRY